MEGVPCEMSGKYVEAVLRLAVAKINKVKVQEMWNEAGLSWKQFLPEDKIDDFLISSKIPPRCLKNSFTVRWRKCLTPARLRPTKVPSRVSLRIMLKRVITANPTRLSSDWLPGLLQRAV